MKYVNELLEHIAEEDKAAKHKYYHQHFLAICDRVKVAVTDLGQGGHHEIVHVHKLVVVRFWRFDVKMFQECVGTIVSRNLLKAWKHQKPCISNVCCIS